MEEIDEYERLRRLIDPRADWHLANWGRWRRSDPMVAGYPTHSTCLECMGGVSSPDASDHVFESGVEWQAEVCDAVIDGLDRMLRLAISNVYEASVWQFRTAKIMEDALIEAARRFWIEAQRRGLT